MVDARAQFRRRLLSRLGEYQPGKIPLILQQFGGAFPDSDAVYAHETSHFTLITNTLYGYFLQRLAILADDSQLAQASRRTFGTQCETLASGIFLCAEGLATLVEHLCYWQSHSREETYQRLQGLPPDYRAAFSLYVKLANRWGVSPNSQFEAFINFWNISLISQAVTEYTVDFPVWSTLQQESLFEAILCRLLQTTKPDDLLSSKLELAVNVPTETFKAILLDESFFGLGDLKARAVKERHYIQSIKRELIQIDCEAAGWEWEGDDATRFREMQKLEKSLSMSHPVVKRIPIHGDPEAPVYPPVRVSFRRQLLSFHYKLSHVAPDEFIDAVEKLAKQKGFVRFVFVAGEPERGRYVARAVPFVIQRRIVTLGKPALFLGARQVETVEITEELLRRVDRFYCDWPSLWVSIFPRQGLLGEKGPRQFGTEVFRGAKSPVFLYCPSFSWDLVDEVKKSIGEIRELVVYSSPTLIKGVETVCLYTEAAVVYSFAPVFNFKGKVGGIDIQKRELELDKEGFFVAKAALVAESIEYGIAEGKKEN